MILCGGAGQNPTFSCRPLLLGPEANLYANDRIFSLRSVLLVEDTIISAISPPVCLHPVASMVVVVVVLMTLGGGGGEMVAVVVAVAVMVEMVEVVSEDGKVEVSIYRKKVPSK
ncbi:hypothetical protein L1987_30550 [Smallanthus sonchifolius]|uniref:Uncharacterized protein n=1 Tax=Smallanthus sonchifolius TaxID=185202 RepID=A0ACB9I2H6_9ASTR|nr:hypothetical protein L1987_30550 [Smallanthus sonchifolius]